jgi:hypothetical protein
MCINGSRRGGSGEREAFGARGRLPPAKFLLRNNRPYHCEGRNESACGAPKVLCNSVKLSILKVRIKSGRALCAA